VADKNNVEQQEDGLEIPYQQIDPQALNDAIDLAFSDKQIEIPFPQRDLPLLFCINSVSFPFSRKRV